MAKINREEYEVLKGLDDRWKWIARDEFEGMFLFVEKPYKYGYFPQWRNKTCDWKVFKTEGFQFIQWEDDEPYNIAELIKEYEFGRILLAMAEEETVLEFESESEETEVKKVDLRRNIEQMETYKFGKYDKHHDNLSEVTSYVKKAEVLKQINQLDEPEVLSLEFINEKAVEVYADTADAEVHAVFRMRDLQNLLVPKQEITKEQAYDKIAESFPATAKEIKSVLEKYYSGMLIEFSEELHESIMRAFVVEATSKTIEPLTGMTLEQILEEARNGGIVPKQELPVIPHHVAKWISVHHEQFDLYPALKRLENNALSWEGVYDWYRKNTRKFVNAYLTGKYEVEEKQKYYVCLGDGQYLVSEDELKEHYAKIRHEEDIGFSNYVLTFTEQEIKDYDERFWPFAVKVEELEE